MGLFSFLQRTLPIDTVQIEQAISQLEQRTSAELRVVVERKLARKHKGLSAIERADQLFDELEMRATAERNGVLIYLCFKPHLVAVVGDEGIHQKVGETFWQAVYQAMKHDCQQGNYTQALCLAIAEVEKALATHFPIQPDDVNELPNSVVIK